MDASKLIAAVVHGAAVKADVSPVDAAKAAAQAAGSEAYWLGSTEEEKARVASWMQAELSNDKMLVADLERALASSSFAALPAHETAADLVLYSALCNKISGETFQQTNPNVARWLNHMQTFVARNTGNPQLSKFRVAGLKATVQSEAQQSAPAPGGSVPAAAAEKQAKKAEKVEEKAEKKEEKAAKKDEKKTPEASSDAGAAAPASADAKKEKKEKKAATEGGEEEPKKKKAPAPATAAAAPAANAEFVPNQLDVRVGKIRSAKQFTEKLYIEEIDVGEDKPRTICSGLVAFYASADMLVGKDVLVVCNLKPRKMADSESEGMVLAASNADKTVVKLVEPPAGSKPGDHVAYTDAPPTPAEFPEPNKVAKKKILEAVMAGWVTDSDGRVAWTDKEAGKTYIMTINGQPILGGDVKGGTVG